mgnify:CR=1 FL=1
MLWKRPLSRWKMKSLSGASGAESNAEIKIALGIGQMQAGAPAAASDSTGG